MIALAQPPAFVAPLAPKGDYRAESSAGREIERIMDAHRSSTRQRAVFSDLEALWTEANQDNWAGREGAALLPGAYWRARDFLEAVLSVAPPPELNVDRSGAVVFDWLPSRERMFSLALAADGRINYAFRAGGVAGSRSEFFRGAVPPGVVEDLAAVLRGGER